MFDVAIRESPQGRENRSERLFCEAGEFVMLAVMVSLNHLDTEARDARWIPFPRYTNGKSFLQLFPSDCANDEGHDDN